ncbi:MAG: ribonuclease E/G [Alphaproteobacteria bacterium]
MSRKMLIDAAFAEEVRIAVVNNGFLEEFEYQNNNKKSTKGHIYLAKVPRVEPSLQAAFVEFGSKKHGFLPFSEIHPDYYQIPVADREKLLSELMSARNADAKKIAEKKKSAKGSEDQESQELAEGEVEPATLVGPQGVEMSDDEDYQKPDFYKRYKIQEVVKKDQVFLVQIDKEERGNKGAALTTYISLAGRYCVYMPNATKGGGVSKKIADAEDRERLKHVAKELTSEMDTGSVIIRTAGAFKTKLEVKRDLGYLRTLWDNIRGHTVKSIAPTFIHEEGDVVKKAVRDIYDNSIDEIAVEGKEAYQVVKDFMGALLPKHVHKVVQHNTKPHLFAKFGIEEKISELYSPQVPLSSGGYIVINQTEALVSIDVNSGRSTSERNIENTALRTNLEAASTISKQIKLRDLSGLIVIDFIDMEDSKNRIAVERALRDALSLDKAKIQIGRISAFGLLEMSRQRLRQSFVESNTEVCEHCVGRGRIRQLEPSSIAVLRALENEVAQNKDKDEIVVSASAQLIAYILNSKRAEIVKLDEKFSGKILFETDETAGGDGFYVEYKKLKKDSDSQEALSTVDHVDIEVRKDEPEEEFRPNRNNNNNRGAKNFKFKHKRRNEDANQQAPNFEDQSEKQPEQNFSDHEAGSNNRRNHKSNKVKRTGGHQKKVTAPKMDMEGDINGENFEKEMADRRKHNQSLLKEIWKKIVD